MSAITKTIVSRPTHLGRKPRTAAALLRQTHRFLDEEGRWIKGAMFKDGNAKRAYERGFCGNWGVCSVGALGVVSGDFKPGVVVERSFHYGDSFHWNEYYVRDSVVNEACAYLALVIDPQRVFDVLVDWGTEHYDGEWLDTVIGWNDQTSRKRKQVLDAFATAADLAAKRGSFGEIARKHLIDKGFGDYTKENY